VNCTDIPRILDERPHRRACERLAQLLPDCHCEQESVCPDLSPGIVRDDEIVARLVPKKYFDTATNTIKPSLFEKAAENGMSVTRLGSAGAHIAERQAPGEIIGLVTALCKDVRAALHDGKRAFAIYDTAVPSNVYHAEICQTMCYPGSLAIKLRRQLQETFSSKLLRFEINVARAAADTPSKPG
jgi:hypothetical protein